MPKHDLKTLKGRLAYAMHVRGYIRRGGQSDLARKAGLTQPSINDILSGRTQNLRGKTLMVLAEALDIRARWLEAGRGPMEVSTTGKLESSELRDEIDDIEDGYTRAPDQVRDVVKDILNKYMSKNQGSGANEA